MVKNLTSSQQLAECTSHNRFSLFCDEIKILGCFDELVLVLKEFLRGDTGIDLCLVDVRVTEYPADGFQWHTLFKCYQTGKRVSPLVEVDGFLQSYQARYTTQMGMEGTVEHIRKERLPRIVVVLLYEVNRFGQQFHGRTVLILTAKVLQPEVAVLVDGKVIIRDGHHIRVGYASVAGEQEHVTGEYMTFVLRVNLEITDFLKGLTAESLGSGLASSRQGEVGEVLPFGNTFLEGTLASLLQQGKEMTGRAFMSALVADVRLEIIDELLCQLPESNVLSL